MHQGGLNKGIRGVVMEILLPLVEGLPHLRNRWRNKCGVRRRRATDPVLGSPDLAGFAFSPAHPGHQVGVYLAYEADRQWEILETITRPVERSDVVHDLLQVPRTLHALGADLELEEFAQTSLGPLDLRAQHGLAANVDRDEQVRIGNEVGGADEPSERLMGGGLKSSPPRINGEVVWRKVRRYESLEASGLLNEVTCARHHGKGSFGS